MTAAMVLAPSLDLRAAAPLRDALLAQAGQPVRLDASRVGRLGGLCLQVLLAAARDWRASGLTFEVCNPSPAFVETLALFGAAGALPPPSQSASQSVGVA